MDRTSRQYRRLIYVVAMLLLVSFAILPTAEARDLSGSRATVSSTSDWWGAAVAWVTELLNIGHTSNSKGLTHRSAASLGGTTTYSGGYQPNTGSCIDPNGTSYCSH
jgi:hypothetical protein